MVHRVTTSENEWQRMTASDNEWYSEWQRVTTSGTTSDNEWQRVTKSENQWQRVTTNGNEWQQVRTVVQQMKAAQYTSKNGWLPSFQWQNKIHHYFKGWMAAIRVVKKTFLKVL